jgi:hypothetical protein
MSNQLYKDEEQIITDSIKRVKDHYIGKDIKIISDYNGQPYGSSKKSLKGTIHKIVKVYYTNDFFIFIKGHRLGLRFDEVEFINE